MLNYTLVACISLMVVLYSYRRTNNELSQHNYCPTSYSNESFATQCQYVNKKEAAEIMSKLNGIASQLSKYLENQHGLDGDKIQCLMARNLSSRYGGTPSLRETHPHNKDGDTSYTIDKGSILSLCLRTGSGDLHDFETLKFVFLHELTHIAANVYQHPDKFWKMFKVLLHEAEQAGLYSPIDYSRYPVKYCGKLDISYNPYYDVSI